MFAGTGSILGLKIVDLVKRKVSPAAWFVREQVERVVLLRTYTNAGMDEPKKAAAYEAVDRFVTVSVKNV